jgi:hypothetical protein
MGKYFLNAGILLNTALIIINRFVKRLPDAVQIPLLILGIGLILTGFILLRK